MSQGWVVCPAFNEATTLESFVEQLSEVVRGAEVLSPHRITLLIVDDGSSDDTPNVAARLSSESDSRLRIESLSLSRNFGQQAALIAGLDRAAHEGADWVCTMDSDGEHPVSLLPQLVRVWESGAPMVHTVRAYDKRVSLVKRKLSDAYYVLLQRLSKIKIRPGMADYKLWDGALLRQVQPFLPHCGLLRLFASWLCPDAPTVEYEQNFVADRPSRFTWSKMFSLGFAGLVRYSEVPLRFFLVAGVVSFSIGVFNAGFALVAVIQGRTVPGWASLLMLVSGFGAVQSLSLGVLAEYFARLMFRRSLPTYVTRSATLDGPGPRHSSSVYPPPSTPPAG